jgi:hypothetical protein
VGGAQVLQDLFEFVDSDGDGVVWPADLRAALRVSGEGRTALLTAAKGLLMHVQRLEAGRGDLADALLAVEAAAGADKGIGLGQLVAAARGVARLRGMRVGWAAGLGLDRALGRRLAGGGVGDGLAGRREMGEAELERHVTQACEDFCAVSCRGRGAQ